MRTRQGMPEPLQHWQVREITVERSRPEAVTVDGEMVEQARVTVRVLPDALKVIVPAGSQQKGTG